WRTMTRPDLAALLRVQERDTGIDRLRYRRNTLPEREAIRERRALEGSIATRAQTTRRDRDETLAEERRLDDEAQSLARRATEVDRIRHDPEAGIASCDNCGAILVPAG